jgi:hypothetical protein
MGVFRPRRHHDRSWGDEIKKDSKMMANCIDCGSQWDNEQPARVGEFAPNAFGLHERKLQHPYRPRRFQGSFASTAGFGAFRDQNVRRSGRKELPLRLVVRSGVIGTNPRFVHPVTVFRRARAPVCVSPSTP